MREVEPEESELKNIYFFLTLLPRSKFKCNLVISTPGAQGNKNEETQIFVQPDF